MIIRVQGASEVQNGIYYEYDNESQPLGQGGMGIVYEARCFRVGNPNEYIPVAIKYITNNTPDLIERAMREASIQIDHPNLLRMYGFIPNMEWDIYTAKYVTRYYVVMDRLVAVDLYSLMSGITMDKSGTNIPYAQELLNLYHTNRFKFVYEIMLSSMQAIDALHKAGYIHRDIDPSNIMVTNEGDIKLIDFGISKTFSSINVNNSHKLTQVGAVIGKSDYAAPEVATGSINDHNMTTDIYALGIMLYQLYSGRLPFTGTDTEVLQAQLNQPIPLDCIDNPSISKVIEKATRKLQKERYQSVSEMLADFAMCVPNTNDFGDTSADLPPVSDPVPPIYVDPDPDQDNGHDLGNGPIPVIHLDEDTQDRPNTEDTGDFEGLPESGSADGAADFGGTSTTVQNKTLPTWVYVIAVTLGAVIGICLALYLHINK